MLEDIRLTKEEATEIERKVAKGWLKPPYDSYDSQYADVQAEIKEALTNAATDKANRWWVEWIESQYTSASDMIVIDPSWDEWQALKSMTKE